MNKPQLASVIFLMTVIFAMSELFAQDTVRSSVFFGYNKQEISQVERSRLDSLLIALGECPVRHIRITGNTDASGSSEYNQRLSADRARNVYDYLAARGLKSEQLEILSQGKSLPLYSGSDENSMAGNRRCDLEISLWEDNTSRLAGGFNNIQSVATHRISGEVRFSGDLRLTPPLNALGEPGEIALNTRPVLVGEVQKLLKKQYLTMSSDGEVLAPAAIIEWHRTGSGDTSAQAEQRRFEEPMEMTVPVKACNCKPGQITLWKPVKLDSVTTAWEQVNDSVKLRKDNRIQQYVFRVRSTETVALMCKPATKKTLFVFRGLNPAGLKIVYTRAKIIVSGTEIEPGVIEIQLPDIKEIPRVYARGISSENENYVMNGLRLSDCRHNLLTGEYVLRQKDFRKKTPLRLKKVDKEDIIFGFVEY